MRGFILAVRLHRGAACDILALSLLISYRVVLATALVSVAWHITYLCFGGQWRCCCFCVFSICLLSCVLLCACVPSLRGWGAHKSLAPRTRTLLGVLGQAMLSFLAVATLLFFFVFCECPKFFHLAKQRRKIFGGVSEVGKDDFSPYFFWLSVFFLVFYFSSAASARPRDISRSRAMDGAQRQAPPGHPTHCQTGVTQLHIRQRTRGHACQTAEHQPHSMARTCTTG